MRIFQIYQKVRYFISFYLPSPHKKSIPQKNSKKFQIFFKFPCTFLPKMKDKFDLYVGRKIPEQNTQEQCMNEYYPPELLKKWNEASLSDNFIFCKVMSENLGKH